MGAVPVVFHYVADPKWSTFNADDIREPSARQTKYRDRRADPRGRVPGDVWEVSRVCGTFRERAGHCCQTPLAILRCIIRATTNAGDLVVDPFAGTGTALVAARQVGRRYLGQLLAEADHREDEQIRIGRTAASSPNGRPTAAACGVAASGVLRSLTLPARLRFLANSLKTAPPKNS
jgi:DNA modification methylase